MDRANKPKTLPKLSSTPGLPPQPTVTFTDDNSRLRADLPTGESVEVLLYGATVISWKDATGDEKLWLSEAAKLDGSKAVRGGIPLVFPVFGTAPDHPQTKDLPQHGFARTSRWEFLGKSTSESMVGVKLDFGLSSAAPGLDPKAAALWPFKFNLIYSVTLNPESLTTSIVATNDDPAAPFDCQVLMHTYLRVKNITAVEINRPRRAPASETKSAPPRPAPILNPSLPAALNIHVRDRAACTRPQRNAVTCVRCPAFSGLRDTRGQTSTNVVG